MSDGAIVCELCGVEAQWGGPSNGDSTNIICPACGSYAVSGAWRAARMVEHLEEPDRVRLRAVIRRDTDEHGRCREVITTQGWRQVMARHDGPTDALAQMERLLVLIAERSPFYGAVSTFDSPSAMAVRAYLPRTSKDALSNGEELVYVLPSRHLDNRAARRLIYRKFKLVEERDTRSGENNGAAS